MRTFIILSLLLPALSYAAPKQWTAIRVNDQPIASGQVENYTEATLLSRQEKIALFKLANRDFDRYQEQVRLWLSRNFERGLREMSFTAGVESTANREHSRMFRHLAEIVATKLADREAEVLAPIMDKEKIGVRHARLRFAENLVLEGYPHRNNEPAEALYWDWFKSEERRITGSVRLEKAKEWANLKTLNSRDISSLKNESLNQKADLEISPAPGLRLRGETAWEFLGKNRKSF